jgi:hypothetical protein
MIGPFADWWSRLQERLGDSFQGDALLYFADDQIGRYKNSRPPAVAFELGTDGYTNDTGARRGPADLSGDPLFNVETQILFHVWGKNPDYTHEMRRALIAALHDTRHGSYRLAGGTWKSGEVPANGSVYVFAVQLKIPITRDLEGKAVITGFTPNDISISHPGVDS